MTCRKQQTKESILKRDKGEVSGDTWAQASLVSVSMEGRMAGATGPPQLGPAGEETHSKAHSYTAVTPGRSHTCMHATISSAQPLIYKTSFLVLISLLSVAQLVVHRLSVVTLKRTNTHDTRLHNSSKQSEIVSNVFYSPEDRLNLFRNISFSMVMLV